MQRFEFTGTAAKRTRTHTQAQAEKLRRMAKRYGITLSDVIAHTSAGMVYCRVPGCGWKPRADFNRDPKLVSICRACENAAACRAREGASVASMVNDSYTSEAHRDAAMTEQAAALHGWCREPRAKCGVF